MKLDEKTLIQLADQLGLDVQKSKSASSNHMNETLQAYEKKNDEELLKELKKMQEKLAAANIPYEKQIAAVESLMSLMDGKQKARLEKLIGLLKHSY